MPTYAEALIDRLQNLRKVALFDPGLAYIGIDAELECLIREVIPPSLLSKWAVSKAGSKPHEVEEKLTKAVRRQRLSWASSGLFPDRVNEFLKALPRIAGKARHGRTTLTFKEANQDIELAVQFVTTLANVVDKIVLTCKLDKQENAFTWSVLKYKVGTTVLFTCSKCGGALVTHTLPASFDALPYSWADPDVCAIAVSLLARELLDVRQQQFVAGDIAEDEFMSSRDFLSGLAGQ